MRAFVLGLFLSVAVLLPKTGNAQVYQFRTPAPVVTAAASDWQINSDPVVVNGLVYYPTRGFRFFDGQVMMQVGVVERVPVYADTTLEPFSIIYVPIGPDRMREYERRRDGELAGTTGSRPPSFPVQSPSVQALRDTSVGAVGTSGLDRARATSAGRGCSCRAVERRARNCRHLGRRRAERDLIGRYGRALGPWPRAAGADREHPAAERRKWRVARVQRRAVVRRRSGDFVLAGSLRTGWRLPRLPGLSRQDGGERRDLDLGRQGRPSRALRETLKWLKADG